jgi:hypothetical protein
MNSRAVAAETNTAYGTVHGHCLGCDSCTAGGGEEFCVDTNGQEPEVVTMNEDENTELEARLFSASAIRLAAKGLPETV